MHYGNTTIVLECFTQIVHDLSLMYQSAFATDLNTVISGGFSSFQAGEG